MNRKIIVFLSVLIVMFTALALPPSRMVFAEKQITPTVIIDAGHGGIDGGAVGETGATEKKINLEIAKKMRAMLGIFGYDTLMTRIGDDYAYENGNTIREKKISDTKARVEMINNTKNAYLISVHLNHFSQEKYFGAQVFHTNDNNAKTVAENIQETLRRGVDKNNKRLSKEVGKNIYIMNKINCPGVLVECGFLSNPREEKLLQTEDYQKRIALSVSVGFADGYKEVKNYEN